MLLRKTVLSEAKIVGGAILFSQRRPKERYIGRVVVDPVHYRKGYGIASMEEIDKLFPGFLCKLDTPV